MAQTRFEQDVHIAGSLTVSGTLAIPSGTVTNDDVQAGANIAASKVVHQFAIPYWQAPGTDIATATADIHIARATGALVSFECAVTGTAATGDRSVTVDLQKSTGAAAFATVLSAVVTLDSGNALRTLEAGTINTTAYVDGDLFRIVVTQVAGTTGTRPQGLIVTLWTSENPA